MDITIQVTNGSDLQIRFDVRVRGESTGELMMERGDFTKFADLLFGRNYTLTGCEPKKEII
jgi:hypothetical protein